MLNGAKHFFTRKHNSMIIPVATQVINSPPTGSSRASDSPLLQHNQTPLSPTRSISSNGSGSSATVQPQPYLYPRATAVEFKSDEPIHGEITHGDAKFIGKIRYVPQKDVSPDRDEEGQQASATSEDGKYVHSGSSW